MTLEERLHAGSRAKEVLENEQFQAAFEATEKEILDQWMNSPARDAKGREALWSYLTLLRKVKANLTQTLETGMLAEIEVKHRRNMTERLQDGWTALTE